MAIITTDGINPVYKDWGPKDARPVMFHYGWPLSADQFDSQMPQDGTLKTYPGLSHGLFATHPEIVNPDFLAFLRA